MVLLAETNKVLRLVRPAVATWNPVVPMNGPRACGALLGKRDVQPSESLDKRGYARDIARESHQQSRTSSRSGLTSARPSTRCLVARCIAKLQTPRETQVCGCRAPPLQACSRRSTCPPRRASGARVGATAKSTSGTTYGASHGNFSCSRQRVSAKDQVTTRNLVLTCPT